MGIASCWSYVRITINSSTDYRCQVPGSALRDSIPGPTLSKFQKTTISSVPRKLLHDFHNEHQGWRRDSGAPREDGREDA